MTKFNQKFQQCCICLVDGLTVVSKEVFTTIQLEEELVLPQQCKHREDVISYYSTDQGLEAWIDLVEECGQSGYRSTRSIPDEHFYKYGLQRVKPDRIDVHMDVLIFDHDEFWRELEIFLDNYRIENADNEKVQSDSQKALIDIGDLPF